MNFGTASSAFEWKVVGRDTSSTSKELSVTLDAKRHPTFQNVQGVRRARHSSI